MADELTVSAGPLGPCFKAQRTITEALLQGHESSQGKLFDHVFLDHLFGEHVVFCNSALEHYMKYHVDFRGVPVLDARLIQMVADSTGSLAPAMNCLDGMATITIPPWFFLFIDLIVIGQSMSDLKKESVRSGNEMSIQFEVQLGSFSDEFAGTVKDVISRKYSAPSHVVDLIVYRATLAKLSVVYHEIGHFLAGHGLDRSSASFSYSDLPRRTSAEKSAINSWGAEITVDTYSCFRLYTFADAFSDSIKPACKNLGRLYIPLFAFAEAIIAPLFVVGGMKASGEGQFSTHPSVYRRAVNVLGSLYFALEPTPNQYFDIRKGALFGTKYYSLTTPVCDQHFLLAALSCERSSASMGLPLSGVNGPMRLVRDSFIAGKTLRYGLRPPYPSAAQVGVDLNLLGLLWRQLSMGGNFYYANKFLKSWFGRYPDIAEDEVHEVDNPVVMKGILHNIRSLPIVRDPVYKTIDDWMSNIARWDDQEESRQGLIEHYLREATMIGREFGIF